MRSIVLTNCEARDVLPSPSDLAQLITGLAERGELAPLMVQQLEDFAVARSEAGLGAGFEEPGHLRDEDIRGYLEPHQATLEGCRELERFINSMDAADLEAIIPALERLEVPMLCVWGTGDPVFELELAHWLRDTVPGCNEVIEVEGGAALLARRAPGRARAAPAPLLGGDRGARGGGRVTAR